MFITDREHADYVNILEFDCRPIFHRFKYYVHYELFPASEYMIERTSINGVLALLHCYSSCCSILQLLYFIEQRQAEFWN